MGLSWKLASLAARVPELALKGFSKVPYCRQLGVRVLDTLFGRPDDVQNIGLTHPTFSDTP